MNDEQVERIVYHLSRIADRLGNIEEAFGRFNENFRENSADSAAMITGPLEGLYGLFKKDQAGVDKMREAYTQQQKPATETLIDSVMQLSFPQIAQAFVKELSKDDVQLLIGALENEVEKSS